MARYGAENDQMCCLFGANVFFVLKKKMNRDFIKGGVGGSSFYEVISQKIFNFTNDSFP